MSDETSNLRQFSAAASTENVRINADLFVACQPELDSLNLFRSSLDLLTPYTVQAGREEQAQAIIPLTYQAW
jgi:hypothetical protein